LQNSVILQLYIIPVIQVVSNFRPGYDYQAAYACDPCNLFSSGITGTEHLLLRDTPWRLLACREGQSSSLEGPPYCRSTWSLEGKVTWSLEGKAAFL